MTQAPDLPADIVTPDPETAAGYRIPDWDAVAGPAADFRTFWEDRAKELEWYEPWHTVLDDSDAPFYKWFTGGKGNRVTIYLPRIPEIMFAMLACAKLGAVHSVVFAGFSSVALKERLLDSESNLVITADGSWVNGKVFELKKIVDEAVR